METYVDSSSSSLSPRLLKQHHTSRLAFELLKNPIVARWAATMPNPTTWIQYVYRLGLILKELKLTPEQFLDALKKKPDEIGIELDVIHSLAYVTPCEGLIQAAGSVNDHLPSQITVDSCIEKQLAQSSIRRVSLRLILWVWMFTH